MHFLYTPPRFRTSQTPQVFIQNPQRQNPWDYQKIFYMVNILPIVQTTVTTIV